MAQLVKNLPAVQETWVRSLGWEDPLEKGTAIHSSILTWKTPWTEEIGRPRGHNNWETSTLNTPPNTDEAPSTCHTPLLPKSPHTEFSAGLLASKKVEQNHQP